MPATTAQPNIVLINCDDLGFGDLGCYGSSANRTPALDSVAAEGVRFTNFYMASSLCSPSRGAMMTGCWPRRIGFGTFEGRGVLFPGQPVGLNPGEVTIATILRARGYATQIIGKWHCGDQKEFLPTRHGFDHYYGLPYSNDMGRQVGHPKPWPPLPLLRDEEVIQQQPDQANLIERYTEEAVRFFRANRARRFFLYLAHMQVHLPHYAPQRFVWASRNGRYGACIEAVDWSTDVLMRELRALGLDDNTLVIFTSDNGSRGDRGGSNGPLRGAKATSWEGGFRVPCLMRWPGKIAPGRVSNEMMASIDFLPTLALLAGAKPPDDRVIDGMDVRALLTDARAKSPRETFLYYLYDRLEAVRRGKWKLWLTRDKQPVRELYDLEGDLGETTSVFDQHPDVVKDLMKLVDATREDLGDDAAGIVGANRRPIGSVERGVPLTEYDPSHPYIVAMYDLPDRG
jgi:arylsulfatase A-like enzyme